MHVLRAWSIQGDSSDAYYVGAEHPGVTASMIFVAGAEQLGNSFNPSFAGAKPPGEQLQCILCMH